jgi:hypothetical protein
MAAAEIISKFYTSKSSIITAILVSLENAGLRP